MLYGYPLKQVNEYGLCELKEITFAASADVLRDVARFLNAMAALMDSGEFSKHSHWHIQTTVPHWDRRCPGKGIIVVSPVMTG